MTWAAISRESRAALVAAVFGGLSAGCAPHTATPNLEVRASPVLIKEKSPLRIAVLVTEEDLTKTHEVSFQYGLRTYEFKLNLGRPLQDGLILSLSAAFDRVTLVRTPPRPGTYHLVLVPKVLDAKVASPRTLEIRFSLAGAMRVLDEAGSELATLSAEAADSGRMSVVDPVGQEASRRAVSAAIGQLVTKWGEQLVSSPKIDQYASRVRPAQPAPVTGSADVVVTLSYPPEGARVAEETISLAGVASARKGIQRLDLVVNGRSVPVSRDVRAQSGDVQSHPFTAVVPLRAGENVIALTAIDASGAANQAIRRVYREGAQPAASATARVRTGERWAVIIGIDQYQDPSVTTLKYAAADAEGIFKFLTTKGGVKPANARLLLNRQATQRAVRDVLGDFLRRKALKDDEVIIYYAGHGTTEPDASAEGGVAKYLVPWDADPEKLFSTAIPMDEIDKIFGRMAARKILMVQDTCFSGGAGGRTFLAKGITVRATSLTDRFLQELSQKEGRMILTASDVNQVSTEDPALGHGTFTHYLLQALDTGAADLDGDGAITVREVHLYLQRKVHEHSRGAQTPQLYNIGDMVLVRKGS